VKKFIIGWMTSKPEMQERFLAAIRAVLAATRQEKGCVFIEINLDLDSPNRAVVAECFESQGAHDIHRCHTWPRFAKKCLGFWSRLGLRTSCPTT